MSRKWIQALLVVMVGMAVLFPQTAGTGETRREQFILGDNTQRIFIQGIRPMGMGGAFTAVANDENAMFYNPAGLARINYWRFTFPDYMIGTDTHSFDNLSYILGNSDQVNEIMEGDVDPEVVDHLSHTRAHVVSDVSMKYIQPHFGFGFWMFADSLVETGAVLLPEANWNMRAGLIENITFGWGWDIPQFGYLAAGLAFKAIQQGRSTEEYRSVLDLNDVDTEVEWGGGFDLGLLYQPTDELSFSLVAADLYTRILGEVQPPNLKMGFAYQPWWINFDDLATTLALDVVELNWQGDNEFRNSPNNAGVLNLSKFRVGVEFLLSGLIALRGGIHQGYPTTGISFITGFINLDWAYYGRELGTYPGQMAEWNHRISVDWHTGGLVAPPATPTPTLTATTTCTPTITPTPPPRPTAQPTLSGNVPKLHGEFIGFKGEITVMPKLADDLGEVSSWTMTIRDRRGKTLRTYQGRGTPPKSFLWNAKDQQRRVSSKEQYPFELNMQTADGNAKTVNGALVIVDTIPKLYTSKNYEVYPDKVYFSIREPLDQTKSWKLDIFDAANRLIRSYRTEEPLFKAFAWDAKDEEGTVVPNNGNYRYELTIVDRNSNEILIVDKLRPVSGQVYPNENRTTIKVGGILFDTGKAYLTAEMFDKVIKCAYLIQDEPNAEVGLEGHTDSTGPKTLNMRLSLVRAESVRRFLVDEQRVPNYQLGIKGWGPTRPETTNATAAGRTKNRRVEVIIRIPE